MLDNILSKFKKNKKQDNLEFDSNDKTKASKSNYLRLESPAPNFIPYTCHYDKKTVLTKNGELLQTLKIVGFTYETLGCDKLNLRDTVRKAIQEKINDSKFSVCLHTIRKKKNLDPSPKFESFFSNQLHKKWVIKNKWDDKYINELHITIIHSGMPVEVNSMNALARLNYKGLKAKHDESLARCSAELDEMVDSLLEFLQRFGAERLELVYDDRYGYHSELLEFFGNIIHLDESPMPLPMADFSKYLARYKVAFGNDALEVRKENSKFFAAVLSLKNYQELSAAAIDKFVQLNQQFVITQTINFVDQKAAKKKFEKQNYLLNLSKDERMRGMIGVDNIMQKMDVKSPTAFCESQITIMIVSSDLERLENDVLRSYKELSKVGVPVVREDLNLEHCFWSQLPGNFYYITRKNLLPTNLVGGFSSLHNFPAGSLISKWGNAITLMKTALGTPYFFNFHVNDVGHTIIVGDQNSGKATLTNFLLSESSKLKPNIFYFDGYHESEIYIRAMGGTYLVVDFKKNDLAASFNPLKLSDSQENREFIKYWFLFLADKYLDTSNMQEYSAAIESAIDVLYSLPEEKRMLRNIAEFFVDAKYSDINKAIVKKTSNWYGKGKYAHIFDNETDDLIYNNNIIAIDVTALYDKDMSECLPVITYFLHFFKIQFLGSPSIMAVANANMLFSSIYFEKNLANILDDLAERNSIVLASASFKSQSVNWNEGVAKIFNEKMATKIFLPDDSSYNNITRIFNLTDEEQMYLEALNKESRQFIIRQSDVSIISGLDLYGFIPELDILSASREFAEHCFDIMVENGRDPNIWVPKIYDEIDKKVKISQAEDSVTVDVHDIK